MKLNRRYTIHALDHDWPISQYYYAYNNGSSDDILLGKYYNHRQAKVLKRHSIYELQRNQTYPRERQGYRWHAVKNGRVQRRWTTIRRKTLANIISNLDNKSKDNDSFEHKWNSIKNYKLDNEKTLSMLYHQDKTLSVYDNELDEPSTSRIERKPTINTTTTTTLLNDLNSPRNSYFTQHSIIPRQNASKIESIDNNSMNNNVDMVIIPISHNSPSPMIVNNNNEPTIYIKKKMVLHSDLDMILFVLGFLFFPIWWYGTWRYCLQENQSIISKRQRCFQLLNYLCSIFSLLLLGLVIGLSTVWA